MSTPHPPTASEEQEARTQRHLAILDTLIAHGMDLANRLHQQATTPAEPSPASTEAQTEPPTVKPITPESIALFDQISRAVRRAILVSRKLAEPLPLAAPKPDPARVAANRVTARKRIIREVEDTIHRKPGAEAETLRSELHERVESVDLDDDIGNRPIHEIITEISRDLGISSPSEQARFKRRTPQDLQALNARAAGSGPVGQRPSNTENPVPHGPGPGSPKPKHPPDPPDQGSNIQKLVQVAKQQTGT